MDKLDRNEMENMTALHGDRVKPFAHYIKTQAEYAYEQFELGVQLRRQAKLDALEHVVDDVFVHLNGVIPTVIAGTATTVPMKCSPEHLRIFSRAAMPAFHRKTKWLRYIAELEAIAKDAN